MTHAEATRRHTAAEAEIAAVYNAHPAQDDLVAVGDRSYRVHWSLLVRSGVPGPWVVSSRLMVRDDSGRGAALDESPPELCARFMEVHAALTAWERNEGPWPLAKVPA